MELERQAATSEDVIRWITTLVPPGGTPSAAVAEELQNATDQLIALFKADGKLDESPVALAMNRTVDLHEAAATARIKGNRILVTGGLGAVGSRLIPILARLGAAEIAIVDIAESDYRPDGDAHALQPAVHRVDINDMPAFDAIFAAFKPQILFHLASIREPGRAEVVVREAIETNVFGTRNVIDLCLKHGVEDAIYSSTGKCFAYVTDHVYTGSKKLAEAQWAVAARASTTTRFRCTRFTHVMENGVVAQDIADGIENGLVGLHGPDRHFNVQNLRQATHLLVNALALSEETPVDGYWSAVDLGWPVNTLELALHKIVQSGKRAAVYFSGVPSGYDEVFFRGQFSWNDEVEYHPLINALEAPTGFGDSSGTMAGARIQMFDPALLQAELNDLKARLDDASLDFPAVKQALLEAVSGLAAAIFAAADLPRIVDVLWWGAAPAWAGPNAHLAVKFREVICLLTAAVAKGFAAEPGLLNDDMREKLEEVAETLSRVDSLSPQAAALDSLLTDSPVRAARA
jgi:nucleoside-diphosphate-sugar epimerase